MEETGVTRFPKPVTGRIPNFAGSERAARRLMAQAEFEKATVVKVNPDSPQTGVRRGVLLGLKRLIMPSPRLKKGFMLLDPGRIPHRHLERASTIRGAFTYGKLCSLEELPRVDLIVVGSVAVSSDGIRIGKGGGYTEIEYGVLRELELIDEKTPIFTTIHDVQIVDQAPKRPHDLVVDALITPSQVVRVERTRPQPRGILWDRLTEQQLDDVSILQELQSIRGI